MSPTSEAQMVKLPRPLVARLDEARGEVTRPDFLGALLDEYEAQDGHAQQQPEPEPEPSRRERISNRTRTAAERAANTQTAAATRPQLRKGAVAGRGAVPPSPPKKAPARDGGVTPSTCPHPSIRRIGDACALCGMTGLKALGKR